MRHPACAERRAVLWVVHKRGRIVRDRSLDLAQFEDRLTALQIAVRIFRIDADRPIEVAYGTVEIALESGLLAARDERRDLGVDRFGKGRQGCLRRGGTGRDARRWHDRRIGRWSAI